MWPYVTAGCLEAAHRAGASNGTLPTCVRDAWRDTCPEKLQPGQNTRTTGRAEVLPHSVFFLIFFNLLDLNIVRTHEPGIWVFARQLERSRRGQYVCACLCVFQLENALGAVRERRRGELFQLRKGSEG